MPRSTPILIIGLVLLAWSARPLFLMAREIVIGSRVNEQYAWVPTAVSNIDSSLQATLGSHHVELLDDVPPSSDRRLEVESPARIVVDGRDYSPHEPVRIRPAFTDPNRYHGSLFLGRIADKKTGRQLLVVAQASRSGYRIVWIDADGRVTEDVFQGNELCEVPVRAMIVRQVASHPIGYCSDILQSWPSLLFPVLYPTSGAVGLILTAFGGLRLWRHRRAAAIR